jgi:hypothetical protein
MWAWGFLGVATWLLAPVFSSGRLERVTAVTFVANGVSSIFSAAWTVVDPSWMMTIPGLVSFAIWNILVFAMSTLAFLSLRARAAGHERRAEPNGSRADRGLVHASG